MSDEENMESEIDWLCGQNQDPSFLAFARKCYKAGLDSARNAFVEATDEAERQRDAARAERDAIQAKWDDLWQKLFASVEAMGPHLEKKRPEVEALLDKITELKQARAEAAKLRGLLEYLGGFLSVIEPLYAKATPPPYTSENACIGKHYPEGGACTICIAGHYSGSEQDYRNMDALAAVFNAFPTINDKIKAALAGKEGKV